MKIDHPSAQARYHIRVDSLRLRLLGSEYNVTPILPSAISESLGRPGRPQWIPRRPGKQF